MNIRKEVAEDLMWPGKSEGFEVVENEITDQSRWMTYKRLVFRHASGLFAFSYGVGSTESQDNEELPDVVECYEVEAVASVAYRMVKR